MQKVRFCVLYPIQVFDHGVVAYLSRSFDADDAFPMCEKVLHSFRRTALIDRPGYPAQGHFTHLAEAGRGTVAQVFADTSRPIFDYPM